MSTARERFEKIVYAAIGAGDSWVETASELISDPDKREKRLETLAKRGKKRFSSLEKNVEKRRQKIRKEIENRLSQERLEKIVGQAREALEPIAERLGVAGRLGSQNGATSKSQAKEEKVANKASEASSKAAS